MPVSHKAKQRFSCCFSTEVTDTVDLKVSFALAKAPYEKSQAGGSGAKWLDSARHSPVWDYTRPHETAANSAVQEIQSRDKQCLIYNIHPSTHPYHAASEARFDSHAHLKLISCCGRRKE